MEKIIDAVDKELLLAELTPDKKLRNTNKGGNEIYVVTYHDSPNVLREIGRLREIAFRENNSCSGNACDLDKYDMLENPYRQLIVWDPEAEKIIGGYRFICGPDVVMDGNGIPMLTSSHLFTYSRKFIDEYLPHAMELGRAFVVPEYQSSKAGRKAIFALDNLWDGLGALMAERPTIKYFFGKVTISGDYNLYCRELINYFLTIYFPDKEKLMYPHSPVATLIDPGTFEGLFTGNDFKTDYATLNREVRAKGETIPPLVNAYIKLSDSMKYFGSSVNDELGDSVEAGILIDFDQMYEEKKERHVDSFIKEKKDIIEQRFPEFASNAGESLFSQLQQRRAVRQARRMQRLEARKAEKAERKQRKAMAEIQKGVDNILEHFKVRIN